MPGDVFMDWPPPYSADGGAANEEAAPAGELAWRPSKDSLDYAHKAMQVTFMGLALIGLVVLLGSSTPRAILKGAARKHVVST